MTNTMQYFGLSETEVIRKDNEFYLSISKISEVLGISIQNIHQTIKRNIDEFEGFLNSKFKNVVGRPTLLLSEEQIYTLCMISRSEKAKEFRRVFAKMIKAIRTKEYIHVSEYQELAIKYESLEEQLQIANMDDAVLYEIPPRKLGRYKKFRKLGLSRKELCKALDLPYSKMKKADKLLGFYKPYNATHLIPYQYISGSKKQRRFEANENTLFSAEA